ncbi:hypothetical protein L7F22_022707 [Adiantum nelumboides]|nr:hypothetical protein [Adiantum nelumboides]
MGRAFKIVILGGGVAAGYAALEFVKHGIPHGDLCIISEEAVAPYERPALSKGCLLPEGAATLPSFHTCVGIGAERQTPKWYKDHGVELVLSTRIKLVDVKRRTLLSAAGETITYKILIIATGFFSLFSDSMADKGKDKLPVEENSSSTRRYRREVAAADTQFMASTRTAARTARAPRPSMTTEEQEENDLFTAQLMSMMGTFEQLAKNPRMQKLLKTKDYRTGSQAETSQQATSRQRQVTEPVERVPTVVTGPVQHVLRLEEFGVTGADANNICYLRNLEDANKLVQVMASCKAGMAVVIGGGYIGMECAAALVSNNIRVTMVFPEQHCMARLFTPEIATFYEDYYTKRGVQFLKGTVMAAFESNEKKKVTAVVLKDGKRVEADMVVVGIGIRPNIGLFEGQLTLEKGGIKVNGKMQTSNASVYAVGDVVTFPLKSYRDVRRLEHVDHARKSAAHAVQAIMFPEKVHEYDYLPYFYSRVFTLSWQFYGDNVGDCIMFGNSSNKKFGAFWVDKGHLVGAFLEGGNKEEYSDLEKVARLKPTISDLELLGRQGLAFPFLYKEQLAQSSSLISAVADRSQMLLEKPSPLVLQVSAGIAVAIGISLFAIWYGKKRRRW